MRQSKIVYTIQEKDDEIFMYIFTGNEKFGRSLKRLLDNTPLTDEYTFVSTDDRYHIQISNKTKIGKKFGKLLKKAKKYRAKQNGEKK